MVFNNDFFGVLLILKSYFLLDSDSLKLINFATLGIIDLIVGKTGVRDLFLSFLFDIESNEF